MDFKSILFLTMFAAGSVLLSAALGYCCQLCAGVSALLSADIYCNGE